MMKTYSRKKTVRSISSNRNMAYAMKNAIKCFFLVLFCNFYAVPLMAQDRFPDGSPVPEWFVDDKGLNISSLGHRYQITDYGVVKDSILVQTAAIQSVIDRAHAAGGGVVVIPAGTYLSGSLFFKNGTHLLLEKDAVLKGSDDISDFELRTTRIEGRTVKYFSALVNADRVDGFTVSGKGTIDGNGLRYWKAFWLRRAFNPDCTNMDEMRPRVLYVSNSRDVTIEGVSLINSPFWTSHFYKCEYLRLLNLHIFAPEKPVKAPSSDAVDLDVCRNVLIKNCYMSVNDDAIALKGGKGPFADQQEDNGPNSNIIIEDNEFGFCHSALTFGSECIHGYNVIFRRNKVEGATRLLQLKMRPDTPQKYEYLLMEDITGTVGTIVYVKPWTQFFDLKGEGKIRMAYANNMTLRNIKMSCGNVFDVQPSDQYLLRDFLFENFHAEATKNPHIDQDRIANFNLKNVTVNGKIIQ